MSNKQKIYAKWDECDEPDQEEWVKSTILDLYDGKRKYIPQSICNTPDFDYDVLVAVRNVLSLSERIEFGRILHNRMSHRVEDGEIKAVGYRPGDYSASLYELAMKHNWCDGLYT